MQWRKALLTGGAAIGAAMAYNAFARRDVAPLANLIGGKERWWKWRGHDVAYTRRGDGPPLLLLHGIHAAAWSFEWRFNVEALARAGHTIYTLDLLGFGQSDRPNVRYSAALYVAQIGDFVRQVVGAPVVLVGNSLTAAYAALLGARDQERYPALVLVEPAGLRRLDDPRGRTGDVTRLALEAPVLGTAMFNTLVSHRSIRHYLEEAYADDSLVTDAMVDVYYQAAHQPGARYAPSAFVARQLDADVRRAMRRLTQPALLVWGAQAELAPVEDARAFRVLKPDAELVVVDRAGDLPHDERPEEFNEAVLGFLARRLHGARPREPEARASRAP